MILPEPFDSLGLDGKPARLGVFGGTFDPIHFGHLRCAQEALEVCGLDGVLFVPAGRPVFKQNQVVTDADARLELCKLAIKDNPAFGVSDLEIARGGLSFTADTLRQLREALPECVELHFITGSDTLATLPKWRDFKTLVELAHFIVVARPGFTLTDYDRLQLETKGHIELAIIEAPGLAIGSTEIRSRVAQGRSVRYWVPDDVLNYIKQHDLYRCEQQDESKPGQAPEAVEVEEPAVIDVLSKKFYKARKEELKDRVSKKRFKHILGVSDSAEALAKTYRVDPKKARLAGLLHDWDKGLSDGEIRQKVYDLGIQRECDATILQDNPVILHGLTAARSLGQEFPEIPEDVLMAIERHTTADKTMTPLDMVLYIADAIEPSRQFGKIDELRALVGEVSLEELFFQTYRYWTSLLFERNKALHPDTISVWNYYVDRRNAQKGQAAVD